MNSVSNKKSIFSIISGVLFIFCFIENTLYLARTFGVFSDYNFDLNINSYTVSYFAIGLLFILAAIFQFIRKPIPSGIVFFGLAIFNFYFFVRTLIFRSSFLWKISDFLVAIAFLMLALLYLLKVNGKYVLGSVCFLPAVLMFFGNIYSFNSTADYLFSDLYDSVFYNSSITFEYFFSELVYLISLIVLVIAILFAGLWIGSINKTNTSSYAYSNGNHSNFGRVPPMPGRQISSQQPYANSYQTMQQQNNQYYSQQDYYSTVESELIALNNMLNNGLITQQDFEEKKKQILGI